MLLNIYSIYDSKSCSFGTPFFSAAKGSAIRTFTDLANDPQTTIAKHPEDYTLFEIASWCDQKGKIEPLEIRADLGNASSYVNPVKKD